MTKQQMNEFITSNKHIFAQGVEISEASLCSWFNIQVPTRATYRAVQKYALAKLNAYSRLNRYLSARGLVIRSVDYGTHYKVESLEGSIEHVERLQRLGAHKLRNADELAAGVTRSRAKWRKLSPRQLAKVRDHQPTLWGEEA